MLGRDRETSGTTGHTADGFAEFLSRKVDDVMSATAGQPAPTVLDGAVIAVVLPPLYGDRDTAYHHSLCDQVVLVGSDTDVSAPRIRRCAAILCHVHGKCIAESRTAA